MYRKGFYHAHNVSIFHMDQNSHFQLLFSWLSFPDLIDAVLNPRSFRFFLTWGNNLNVLGLSTMFVRHARPGIDAGSAGCWIHAKINSSELREASQGASCCASLRLGMRARGETVWFYSPGSFGCWPFLDQLRHLSPCSQAVLVEEWFQKRHLFTDLPASCGVWVALCSQKHTRDTSKVHSDWIEKIRKTKKKGNGRILRLHL